MDRTAWDERYASKDYLWTVEPNRFVQQHVSQLTPGTAIDLATGEGRNAVWLAGQGWQATAVDFSPVGPDKAGRLAADHDVDVEWVEADLAELVDHNRNVLQLRCGEQTPQQRGFAATEEPGYDVDGYQGAIVGHAGAVRFRLSIKSAASGSSSFFVSVSAAAHSSVKFSTSTVCPVWLRRMYELGAQSASDRP